MTAGVAAAHAYISLGQIRQTRERPKILTSLEEFALMHYKRVGPQPLAKCRKSIKLKHCCKDLV